MKIIEPYIEHWKQGDDVKAHVAKCARVCYGKETGNDDVTINTLLKKHHWSMFRHESVYVIGEFTSRLAIALERYSNNPYINWTFHNNKLYIATNGNFCLDLKECQEVNAHAQILLTYINYYRVSEDTFFNEDIPNILEEYGLKESECNYMITEFPCKTINLTYENKIVNKEDKIQDSKVSI